MSNRNLNEKAFNKENKRNDIGRPEGKKGNKKTEPRYKSFDGKPIE